MVSLWHRGKEEVRVDDRLGFQTSHFEGATVLVALVLLHTFIAIWTADDQSVPFHQAGLRVSESNIRFSFSVTSGVLVRDYGQEQIGTGHVFRLPKKRHTCTRQLLKMSQ